MTSATVFNVVIPADDVPGPPQGQWTYDDYARMPDDGQRYEIIEGVLYIVPSPGESHQNADVNFTSILVTHVKTAGLGRVYVAPFDVELPHGVVVQPDILVVLNAKPGIITPSRISGTPDLVVEVASPGTATYDRSTKRQAYARAGVPEYWIADPHAETIEVLVLEEGRYRSRNAFGGAASVPSRVLSDLSVRVEQFFA
jgi:Uma2 family endonuclease